MTTKTHLTAQEEGIPESGAQIRTNEPISPVDNQVWIRADQKRIKIKNGANIVILAEGSPDALPVSGLVVDAALTSTFFDSPEVSTEYSVNNLVSGQSIQILVINTNLADPIEVSFAVQFLFDNSETGTVDFGKKKLFTLTNVGDTVVVSGKEFN